MALELRGVARAFGSRVVVSDVSLAVEPGRIVGLLGPNGAGKTTAMRIALGLSRADAGRVVVDGYDAASEPREVRARTGGLIETPGFQPGRSALHNLVELARLGGLARDEARAQAERALERVGLAADAARNVEGFSQGMRQRLGIAQALLGSPRYLILDEPQNGLDPEAMASLRALLRELATRERMGLLVSSHQLAELSEIATDVVVLRSGVVVHRGSMADLLAVGELRHRVRTRDAAATRAWLAAQRLTFEELPGGAFDVELGSHSPDDAARALVAHGLLELAPRRRTLEEAYLRALHPPQGASALPALASKPDEPRAEPRRAPRAPLRLVVGYELRRVWGGGRFLALLALPCAAGILALVRRVAQGEADANAVSGGEVFSATNVTAFEGVAVALAASLPILALIVAGLASQSIAGELARGTLRNLLLRPVERTQVALGKALALAGLVGGAYVVLAGVLVGAAGIALDFGDVSEILPNGQPFVLVSAGELWPELARALALPVLALLSVLGLGLACGALARSSAGALALALGALVGLDLARLFARGSALEAAFPSAHLPSPLADTSIVEYFLELARGVSSARWSFASESVWVPLAWCALSVLVARAILRRRTVP